MKCLNFSTQIFEDRIQICFFLNKGGVSGGCSDEGGIVCKPGNIYIYIYIII